MNVLGVDGCRQGWVGVVLADGAFDRACTAGTMVGLIADVPEVRCIGVDMPVGLVDAGWRAADLAVREELGARRSTLFMTAPRAALEEPDYAKALEIARRLTGSGISKQAFNLREKILEIDALRDARIHEVHPELSFSSMNGAPLASSKKTWAGQQARLALLRGAGIEIPADVGAAGRVAPDDLLDAAAAAWSAARVLGGVARAFPAASSGAPAEPTIWA